MYSLHCPGDGSRPSEARLSLIGNSCQQLLDLSNSSAWVEALGTGLGAVHDCVAPGNKGMLWEPVLVHTMESFRSWQWIVFWIKASLIDTLLYLDHNDKKTFWNEPISLELSCSITIRNYHIWILMWEWYGERKKLIMCSKENCCWSLICLMLDETKNTKIA